MKLTTVCSRLYKRSTTHFPNMEHYKYTYYRDPVLKNKVSGKGEKEPRAVCVEEMTVMLNCLKNSDFDQKPCTQLINAFKTCVQTAEASRKKAKELRKSGVFDLSEEVTDSGKRLPAEQVTKLLRRFPEPT
ncbi:unnamed protein product [Calicophoron daubneyi]|uniref:Coiled-coil-helix-coiled-coil-helix domain-containing protein 1 n=1 Tax=Calicophoron daubneyi TaxID=300641 RepID=A0AAV2TM08_CALDB